MVSRAMTFDPIAYGRSAIEPHPQDSYREIQDVIIDILRDSLDWLLTNDRDRAENIVQSWIRDGSLLFRRLAVYGYGNSSHTADEKAALILTHDLLLSYGVKYEVFHLLAASVRESSPGTRQDLLAKIETSVIDPEYADYTRYNLLVWLTQCDENWPEAREMLASLQQENIDFRPREYPEFDSWTTTGSKGYLPPFSDNEFAQMVLESPASAIAQLLEYDYSDDWAGASTWGDAVELVARIVAETPTYGIQLWDALSPTPSSSRHFDLKIAITRGWSKETIGEDVWREILDRISAVTDFTGYENDISGLLLTGVRGQNPGIALVDLPRAESAADALWRQRISTFVPWSTDWLFLGLNSWPGKLADFWIHVVSRRKSEDPNSWPGLDTIMKERFQAILTDEFGVLGGAKAMVGSELRFLFHADEEFVTKCIFPVMSGRSGSENAQQIWEGYLHSSRVDLRMIARGFARVAEDFRPDAVHLNQQLRLRYFELIAVIATATDSPDPDILNFMKRFLDQNDPDSIRDFLMAIKNMLRSLTNDQIEASWDLWLSALIARLSHFSRVRDTGLLNQKTKRGSSNLN